MASVLDGLDLEVAVYDARPEWADQTAFPASTHVLRVDPRTVVPAAKYSESDAIVVMTHDHDLDLALIDALLDKPVGFLGVIGSEHKARVFRARLPAPRRALWDERVQCPIGRKLPSKRPKAIAVGVAASLLEHFVYRRAPAAPALAR
ncbi:MAG: XdhC family protein [Elusimicrobia bacterium]|nr:XdhC family protein [Elusimicrobiota bacterium]